MFAAQSTSLWLPSWLRAPLAMAHIRKSATTGHILKTASGHIAKSCSGIDTTNCHTSCSHTSFPAVVTGTTATDSVYPCGCLNATYTMAYTGRLTWVADSTCAELDDLIGRAYCHYEAIRDCDASPFLTDTRAIAQMLFFEGSPTGAIDVVFRLLTGWYTGFVIAKSSVRYWRDTIAEDTVCDAMNYVRSTGFDFNGGNLLCDDEDPGGHACELASTTVSVGP